MVSVDDENLMVNRTIGSEIVEVELEAIKTIRKLEYKYLLEFDSHYNFHLDVAISKRPMDSVVWQGLFSPMPRVKRRVTPCILQIPVLALHQERNTV